VFELVAMPSQTSHVADNLQRREILRHSPGRGLSSVGLIVAVMLLLSRPALSADKAAINKALARGASYLRSVQGRVVEGRSSLCAYALLKAGVKPNDPAVASTIAEILSRCEGDAYKPRRGDEVYAAGIEAMLLADAGGAEYLPALQKMARYLMEEQRDDGSYSYRGPGSPGDISLTQYAALGLWACNRAGVEIPLEVWDKLAQWHIKSQMSDGGFQYTPGTANGVSGARPNLTMTAAAAATMAITEMFLELPAVVPKETKTQMPPKDPNDPLGVLNVRKPDPDRPEAAAPPEVYKQQVTAADVEGRIRLSLGWVNQNFTTEYREDLRMYNYYTLERMGALTEVETLGGQNWFDECATRLFASQQPDGSWTTSIYDSQETYVVGTSLAMLFLTRSTAKLINRTPPVDPIGGGLQVGGRGLPDDLSAVTMQNGRVAQDQSMGPLDDLLKSLEKGAGDDLFNLQTQIVKKIQLGDRGELIGQTDRLVKLLEYPDPGIRRTALWALARSDDLGMARHMVAALEDPDRDVLVEAHNALCWLSRRPNAFDIPPDPIGELPPDATEEQKQQAVEKWRASALKHWGTWYLRMCSYEERNTPFAHDLAAKIGFSS
jgi:hypothetical protein